MTITSLFLFISFIFIGIVFIGVGIFFQALLRSKINQYSIHSTAIVKKKLIPKGCQLEYIYNGETYQVNTYVDNVPSRYHVDDSVEIAINPQKPDEVILNSYSPLKAVSYVCFLLGVLNILIPIFVIIALYIIHSRQ